MKNSLFREILCMFNNFKGFCRNAELLAADMDKEQKKKLIDELNEFIKELKEEE